MKKIYTLFAAAAVAMSATAAVPVSAEMPALKGRDFTPAVMPAGKIQFTTENSNRMHKAPAKASVAAAPQDLEALYLQDVYSMVDGWYSASLNELVYEADGTFTINGFAYEAASLTNGVWDQAAGTITFQPQNCTFSLEDGTEVTFYFSTFRWSWDDENYVANDEPMVFTAYPEDREIFYKGDLDSEGYIDSFIGVIYEIQGQQSEWDYYYIADLNEVNSFMQFSYLAEETDTELTDIVAYIYTSIDSENFYCDNMFGVNFGYPVPFAVNASTNTATVTNGLVAEQQDSKGNVYQFYLYDLVEGADGLDFDDTVVDFQIMMQDGMTLLYAPYTACLDANGNYTLIPNVVAYNMIVVYQGDLIADMAGVEDIRIDTDNTNAPVEYFNLQGQRVANPAAGQVYIRRQGSEATKVLVR
ncbi:MAG: hypothetical protein ACI4AM_04800 [Muribaculaceae bacterium]